MSVPSLYSAFTRIFLPATLETLGKRQTLSKAEEFRGSQIAEKFSLLFYSLLGSQEISF